MAQTRFSFRLYWRKHHLVILGVVLTAVCALYAFLTYHYPLKPTPETKTTEPKRNNEETNKIEHSFSPPATKDTPEKILAEIEAAPPLQRDAIAKTYTGIPVDWVLYFIGGSAYKDEYRLSLGSSLDLSKAHISCTVPKLSNEYLLRLQKNSKLRVQGNIERIESAWIIYLNNVKIVPL